MTMIERIADALLRAIAQTGRGDDLKLKDMNTLARAALAAMREPNVAMYAAVDPYRVKDADTGYECDGSEIYQAMIDAAITEGDA